MTVEYRDVVGFPGYKVGSDGTVWSCFEAKGGSLPGGIGQGGMKMGSRWKLRKQRRAGGNNAWRVNLCRNGKVIGKFVHVLVLEAFVGPRPPGLVSRHGPKGKDCNHSDNLRWGTQKDNIADKERDGTRVFGVKHHEAKMTPEKVREARRRYSLGESGVKLAVVFGVSMSTMYAILKRKWWKEVS